MRISDTHSEALVHILLSEYVQPPKKAKKGSSRDSCLPSGRYALYKSGGPTVFYWGELRWWVCIGRHIHAVADTPESALEGWIGCVYEELTGVKLTA